MSCLLSKRAFFISVVATASTIVQAYPEEGFSIAPSLGYYNMDNERGVENSRALSLGLGYQFGNPWAVELVYLNADTKSQTTDVDVDQLRLDGLYHFDDRNNFTPYFAGGIGKTDFSPGSNNALINAGGGLKYTVNKSLSLRADFRLIKDTEDHELDNLTSIGLHFLLSNTQSPTSEVSTPIEEIKEEEAIVTTPVVVVTDGDQDGVTDAQDQCLTTPYDVEVGSNGCALDDDKDGIANHLDMCPTSSAGAEVDEKGCYVVLDEQKTVSLDIQFANNSIVIEQQYYTQIQDVANFLKENPETAAIIEGHTDDRGSHVYNQSISERRAQAVMEVLINNFDISADRIDAVGYGEEKPLASNDSASGRNLNRRVAAVISN